MEILVHEGIEKRAKEELDNCDRFARGRWERFKRIVKEDHE